MYCVRKLPLLIALASTSVATISSAETDLNLDELVVTDTRSESPLLDLAGNTGKVTTEEIDLLNADHISKTLLRIPGVNLQRGSGVEMTIALRSPVLTGPGAGGTFLFMEDGIPLRAASFGNNQGLSVAHYEQAGSIEVVSGPGSVLYGSNAVHGLFNVLSRDPSSDLERKIDITAGSDDLYKVRGTVSDTVGAHAYHFSFSGVDDGGWRDDTGLADGSPCFAGTDCLYKRPTDREDRFNDWSPKLGLVYRLAEEHSLYTNLSRGHRAPQITDLYRIQKDQTVGETDSKEQIV